MQARRKILLKNTPFLIKKFVLKINTYLYPFFDPDLNLDLFIKKNKLDIIYEHIEITK